MARTLKTQTQSTPGTQPKRVKHRPMPTDPRDLARAMFRQADQRMFEGRTKKKSEA